MKNYIYSTLVLFFIGINTYGQSPTWSVNENNFQYTMSFVAFVNIDGTNLTNTNDKVAAFVNGECRGITNLTYVASKNRYYAYLTVFSNENNETLNFKIYDAANNVVKDIPKTKSFEINGHYGNLFQAYSIASPTLSNAAEILDFNFSEIEIIDKLILDNQITIDVDNSENVTALNAIYDLSSGAKLYIGTMPQVSGNNSIDFSNPVQFQVLSEDQSVLKQWEVIVNLSLGNATYYKKDAVCYEGGIIKVLFTENNQEVVLSKSDIPYATQSISNGETVFNNLEAGNYKVKVGGNVKEIIIKLKE